MANLATLAPEHPYTLTAEQEAELPARVKGILGGHVGRDHAITAKAIALELRIHDPDGRKVRVAIARLRAIDEPICADPSCGFWRAANLQEGVDFMDRLDHILHETQQLKMEFRRAVKRHFGWDPSQPPLL